MKTRADFLSAITSGRRYAVVPLSGGEVRIQSLTERERSRYDKGRFAPDGSWDTDAFVRARRLLIVLCVVDDNGKRILTEEDVEALGEGDAGDMNVLHEACVKHCGLERRADVGEPNGNALTKNGATDAG